MKTRKHPTIIKIVNDKNNPKNALLQQLKVAEENYDELLRMFKNGEITEEPLSKIAAKKLVHGCFEIEDHILNQTNTSIYTGYTGVGLKEEPYRF